MKTLISPLRKFAFVCAISSTLISANAFAQTGWTKDPFDDRVFVENKGQFDHNTDDSNVPVRFGARVQGMETYFTATGVCYQHGEVVFLNKSQKDSMIALNPFYIPEKEGNEKHDEEERYHFSKVMPRYLKMEWVGCNPNAHVETQGLVSDYFTYPKDKSVNTETIIAQAYQKITYQNIYPNIDIEYIIPKDKEGTKYSIILHPGADLSVVKMKYSYAKKIKINDGNVEIESSFGDFIDHAPVTFYTDDHQPINSHFELNGNVVSFTTDNYDNTKTVTIDPWTTNPAFVGWNRAYDVVYDVNGNVWAYGGAYPWTLKKFNSAGVAQWTYNAAAMYNSGCCTGSCYGDVAVDETSGSCYLSEGFDWAAGSRVFKVNTSGVQVAASVGNPQFNEIWRMEYNRCINVILGAGGGTSGIYQGIKIDTTFTTMTPVNSYNAISNTDNWGISIDPVNPWLYMCTVNPNPNPMIRVPVPALAPFSWNTNSGFGFSEISSALYVTNGCCANGYNGMSASLNWLYMTDGSILKKINKATGAIVATTPTGGTIYASGGTTSDICDNVYVGIGTNIKEYSPALSLISTIPAAGTIYDVKLGPNNGKIYASGDGFVSQLTVPITTTVITMSSTPSSNCVCNGTCTASMTICGAPAVGVTYSWSPSGGTNATATNRCPGLYTCWISTGCNVFYHDTVTVHPSLSSVSLSSTQVNVSCNGGCNGSAQVTPSGGTAPYTYVWSPAVGTGVNASNLCAGSYTVTVTDALACTGFTVITITQPPLLTLTLSSQVNVLCNGSCNGTATVTAGGGTPGYTYNWTPSGGTGVTATGLCAGNYTCTVTDTKGCTKQATVTITQPPLLTATTTQVNILCNGSCTGSSTVTAGGGTPAYTYNWTPSGGTNATATGLCAGTYTCTVTDANACTKQAIVTITQPTALTATTTQVNVSCNGGCNGTSTVTAGGGTPSYTYNWTPSGGTGATGTGLCAGNYTVTVTDANGCTRTATVTITQPPVLTVTTTMTQSTCSAANGTATATAAGGTPVYTYAWAPSGGTNATATGLAAGSYTVTVTDSKGCTATSVIVVTSAAGGTASISASTNVLCFGGNTGSASVTVVGGTAPYTYVWSPSGGTTANATGLTAGTYTVTVTDANGCITSTTVTITQPPLLTSSFTQVNVLCNGSCTGSATVTAGGGTAPYSYAWNPSGQATATATGLCAGTYTCTTTDSHGCTATSVVTITQPAALTSSTTQVNVSCNGGCNGTSTVTAGGGVTPYTYLWSPSGGSNATATGLCAGNYTCTITDANGCTRQSVVTITQPTALSLSTSSVSAICGQGNGSATVIATGGTPAYTYVWAPGGQTGATATALSSGTYTVTVTDANGCTLTATATVNNTAAPTVTIITTTNVTCFGQSNGSITTNTTGGTAPYSYVWSPTGGTNANATGLGPNTYTVTVTDANGCTSTATATVTQPTQLTSSITASVNVLCFGGNNGSATVSSAGGTPAYTYNWAPSGGTNATATGLTAGNYTVTTTDANGCTSTSTVTITEPTQLVVAVAGFNATCSGSCNGQGVCIPSGGTGPYTFSWAPSGGNNPSATGLCAGTYTVYVTDANGCAVNDTAIVNQPVTVTATTTQVNVLCNGTCTGSATVTATGGTTPYSYNWNTTPNQSSATATGLCAGNYTVVVTDFNGCTTSVVVTITQPPALTATTTQVNILCNGSCNGTATVTASGGNPGYTYNWNTTPAQSTATATGLCAGNYTVTVTDANGCTITAPVTITQPTALTVTASAAPAVVCIGNSSTLSAVGAGGTPAYTYVWNPGNINGSSTSVSPTSTTTYTVTITDANGCTDTSAITVVVNPLPVVTFTTNPSPAVGCAPLCVTFTNTTPNSTSCFWNFGNTVTSTNCTDTYCYTIPGTYDVSLTVTDNNGCSNSLTMPALVIVYPNPVADFSFSPQPTTMLNGTIQFTDLSQGNPTSWTWSFGDIANSGSNIQNPSFTYTDSGNYVVELWVENQYGCRDSIQKTVRIDPDFTLYVPNAFTPESQGPNNTFYPKGVGIDEKCYKMWIFDRWGNMIWFTEKWGKGWDGHANDGKDVAQEDVYVWKIDVCDFTGLKHSYIGHVSLIK